MATKLEQELQEKINELENRLTHSYNWMHSDTPPPTQSLSAWWRRIRRVNVSDRIIDFAERVRHIHLLKRRYTRGELWLKRIEALMVGAAIILFWRGVWNLADQFLFAGHPFYSSMASLII